MPGDVLSLAGKHYYRFAVDSADVSVVVTPAVNRHKLEFLRQHVCADLRFPVAIEPWAERQAALHAKTTAFAKIPGKCLGLLSEGRHAVPAYLSGMFNTDAFRIRALGSAHAGFLNPPVTSPPLREEAQNDREQQTVKKHKR